MSSVRSLAKDTAIYGLSSIIGRFLNWCLVPLYTIMFAADEYGVVTYIYSVVALALIILIYGMETGFFRFANHDRWKDPMEVYSTGLISLAVSSSVFLVGLLLCLHPASRALQCAAHPEYVWMMGVVVALDAFTSLPFAYLRYRRRPIRFAVIKLTGIALNIGLNLFFILLCPWLMKVAPGVVDGFYSPTFGIGYIFLANLVSSAVTALMLIPELCGFRWRFNRRLWREMMVYSMPLLVLGVAGIMNQTVDKLLLPYLVSDPAEAMTEVGIYGANYKIGIVMVMFIQAFRFAYEPFIFAQSRDKGEDRLEAYRQAMKWFVIFAMIIFMGVMFYLPVLKYFISPRYFSGLKVVPVIMIAEFFFGVFFNLSLWYKLTDRTIWGTWYSLLGLAVTLAMNGLLVPVMGYMGCALAALTCYGVMMVASYLGGRRYYPIGYNVPRLALYFFSALAMWGVSVLITTGKEWFDLPVRTVLLVIWIAAVMRHEKIKVRQLIPRRV